MPPPAFPPILFPVPGPQGLNGYVLTADAFGFAAWQPGGTGTPGSVWFFGTGAPNPAIGVINDDYLDTASGNIYQKTGPTTWTLKGNLKGATGATGPTGATGATGANGASLTSFRGSATTDASGNATFNMTAAAFSAAPVVTTGYIDPGTGAGLSMKVTAVSATSCTVQLIRSLNTVGVASATVYIIAMPAGSQV